MVFIIEPFEKERGVAIAKRHQQFKTLLPNDSGKRRHQKRNPGESKAVGKVRRME